MGNTEVAEAFGREIEEQGEALERLVGALTGEDSSTLARASEGLEGQATPALWTGLGASLCAAQAGASAMCWAGRSAVATSTSELLHYELSTEPTWAGPVILSTSGQSAEVVALLESGALSTSINLCDTAESPLGQAEGVTLAFRAGPELANATKTYTNAAALAVTLGLTAAREAEALDQLGRCAEAVERWLDEQAMAGERMAEHLGAQPGAVTVVARGPALSAAAMGALCLREMLPLCSVAEPAAEYRHGSATNFRAGAVVLVLATGRTRGLSRDLAFELASRGGRVVLVTDSPAEERSAQVLEIPLPALDEPWAAVTANLPLQALCRAYVDRFGTRYRRRVTTRQ